MAAAADDLIVVSPPQYHMNNDPRGRNEGPQHIGADTSVRESQYPNVCMISCLHTSDIVSVGSSKSVAQAMLASSARFSGNILCSS